MSADTMEASRSQDKIALRFTPMEKEILSQALASIRNNYALRPQEVDPRVAAVWYSQRGCQSSDMSEAETAEWLAQLHAFKSANLQLLQNWERQLATRRPVAGSSKQGARSECYRIQLGVAEAPSLLTVLNDHRLFLAAQHDIGQKEMDAFSLDTVDRLTLSQRIALLEIHFLAGLMEGLLRLLPGSPGEWG